MSFLERFVPILIFLLSITVLSEIATFAEVFDRLAQKLAKMARGSLLGIYLIVTVTASLITIFLGLDTTAVLFTPVVIALANRIGAQAFPFAMATLLLSNTASLMLPVSNLTNLLAQTKLKVNTHLYVGHVFLPAIVAIILSIVLLLLRFRTSIQDRYQFTPLEPVKDKPLLYIVSVACILFIAMVFLNLSPIISSVVAASISALSVHVRHKGFLAWNIIPWRLLLFTSTLFAAISFVNKLGLAKILTHITNSHWEILLSSTLLANLFNNLPTYLAFESLQKTADLYYVLIGTNFGSIIFPCGSLATLLWAQTCRANEVEISWSKVVSFSALCAAVIVPVSALFL